MTTRNDTLPVPERVENLLRDEELFRGWLEAREPGAVVGYARSDTSCPLTRFLREFTGDNEICVTYRGVDAHRRVTELPRWAWRFIDEIELAEPDMPPLPVTAAEARRALEIALGG